MNEPEQQPQDGLVPAGSSALAIRSSGLVKRGLELIRDGQVAKRKIRVLIGDRNNVHEIILDVLKYYIKGEVVATCAGNFQTLMRDAQGQQFNLCIVVLNNILGLPKRGSLEGQAAFIAELKQTCQCPIMALAADGLSHGETIIHAGASYFSRLPFSVPEFMEAVNECLIKDGQLKKGKILITDDIACVLETIKLTLEHFGYEAVSFRSKVEALERLREIKPDLVTTDLNAPQLNGFEFIRRVKGIDPSIPVIVISGHLTAENEREAIRLGAFDCLRKPCSVAELQQVVERALETGRSSPAS